MIEERIIGAVVAQLRATGVDAATVADLRRAWPALHITACAEDDVCGPAPVHEDEHFSIYLVAARDRHCIEFTDDPDEATGLVVAGSADAAPTGTNDNGSG